MVQEGLNLVFLLGAGLLLLRPSDFPLFARVAGRFAGVTVRSLRTVKDAAERAIAESTDTAHRKSPEVIAMHESLRQSLDKFESLTTAVRRDIADVPLNPALFLRKSWRSKGEMISKRARPSNNVNETEARIGQSTAASVERVRKATYSTNGVYTTTSQLLRSPRDSAIADGNPQGLAGADIISRAIEEAALARQRQRIFAKTDPLHSGSFDTKKRRVKDS